VKPKAASAGVRACYDLLPTSPAHCNGRYHMSRERHGAVCCCGTGIQRVAITELERKRRRWRVLYAVYAGSVDSADKLIGIRSVAESQEIPIASVNAAGVFFREHDLVKIERIKLDNFGMRITDSGKTVVEKTLLDSTNRARRRTSHRRIGMHTCSWRS
jgi:hypothetical protein